ncbi:uncharacterized protein LOC127720959 [Mytilus californianus]|uniref:uncharacterized protein LOC127720959 n=1 Tax=Mytilus californianus TaxID=6549 RepID=UPI0022458FFA|nr:uncharacterized protein LOC127720959 [Mytilus californianus]
MATAESLCDVCQLQNISKPAALWCSECEEAFCIECDDLHSRRKLTKNHKKISIRDYQKLPQSALEIKHHCSVHEEKYELYCTNHVSPCCVKCAKEDHKKCEIDSLRNVVQNIKTSSSVTNIEQNLSEIQSIFQKIMDEKRSNLKHMDEKTKTYQKEIPDLRKQINCHLDSLELEMNKNIRDKQQEVKTKAEGFMSIIDSKIKNVEKAINNINQMKSHSTDLQIFLALREIEKDVKKEHSYIKELKTNPELKTVDVQLQVSNGLKSLQNVKVWGEISIKTFDSTVCTEVTTEKQAQIILPCKSRKCVSDIHSITLKKNTSFKVQSENCKLAGCEIVPDGDILLVNQTYNIILMYNQSGGRIKEFKMPWKPYDITYICNDIVAISFIAEKKVCTFNTKNEQLDTFYTSSEKVYGIAYKHDKLFLRCGNIGIRIITLSGTLISDIKFDSHSTLYLCVGNSGQIYYPKSEERSVNCCDRQGNIQWTVTSYLLSAVRGITCGLNGIVFAADNAGGVTVISADGQQSKRILDKSSGPRDPYCIHFSDRRNQLLVCNQVDGQAFLYDVH